MPESVIVRVVFVYKSSLADTLRDIMFLLETLRKEQNALDTSSPVQ